MRKNKIWMGILAIVAALSLITVPQAVYSAWFAPSVGDGAAASGEGLGLVVSPGTPVDLLFPGGSGDVAVNISNPNEWDVTVTSITGNGPVTSLDAACQAAGHEVTFENQTGSWLIPAGGSVDLNLVDAAVMGENASDECQGVEFTVPLALAG